MLLKNIIRYFCGYVTFKMSTNSPANHLNKCAKGKIQLRNVVLFENGFTAECNVSEYKKLQKIKASGVRRKITKKIGLRFQIHRYRKRWGLLIGALLMIGLLIFLSGFVWSVDVSGNDRLSENVIIQTLAECGFKEGVHKSKIQISKIESEIKNKLYDVSWISINIDGSCAHVEIKERYLIPKMEDDTKPSNLVASTGGKIIRMEITKGKPIALVGSGVAKGELLVSGLYNDKKDNVILEHSRGKVTAEVETRETFTIPRDAIRKIGTEKKTYYSLEFFSGEIDLSFGNKPTTSEWTEAQNKQTISIFGLNLPFRIVKHTFSRDKTKQILLDDAGAKERLNAVIEHYESENFSEGRIVSRNIIWETGKDDFTAIVDYVVHIDIAKQQYIEVEE